MPTIISDVSGNRSDKIANAAKVLGRAPQRKLVFSMVYSGKKRKTVTELIKLTKLSQVRVLQEAKKLVAEDIITEVQGKPKEKTFEKIAFYNLHKNRILALANDKKKLDKFPTKVNPKINGSQSIILKITKQRAGVKQITIDHIVLTPYKTGQKSENRLVTVKLGKICQEQEDHLALKKS